MSEIEIKLEVGKKYNIPGLPYNPFTFIGYKSDFGFVGEHDLMFLDRVGDSRSFKKSVLDTITEHREPFNKSLTKWVIFYSKDEPASEDYDLDDFLEIACAPGEVFSLKNYALKRERDLREMGFSNKKVAKIEITITEESLEPEDANP